MHFVIVNIQREEKRECVCTLEKHVKVCFQKKRQIEGEKKEPRKKTKCIKLARNKRKHYLQRELEETVSKRRYKDIVGPTAELRSHKSLALASHHAF